MSDFLPKISKTWKIGGLIAGFASTILLFFNLKDRFWPPLNRVSCKAYVYRQLYPQSLYADILNFADFKSKLEYYLQTSVPKLNKIQNNDRLILSQTQIAKIKSLIYNRGSYSLDRKYLYIYNLYVIEVSNNGDNDVTNFTLSYLPLTDEGPCYQFYREGLKYPSYSGNWETRLVATSNSVSATNFGTLASGDKIHINLWINLDIDSIPPLKLESEDSYPPPNLHFQFDGSSAKRVESEYMRVIDWQGTYLFIAIIVLSFISLLVFNFFWLRKQKYNKSQKELVVDNTIDSLPSIDSKTKLP